MIGEALKSKIDEPPRITWPEFTEIVEPPMSTVYGFGPATEAPAGLFTVRPKFLISRRPRSRPVMLKSATAKLPEAPGSTTTPEFGSAALFRAMPAVSEPVTAPELLPDPRAPAAIPSEKLLGDTAVRVMADEVPATTTVATLNTRPRIRFNRMIVGSLRA